MARKIVKPKLVVGNKIGGSCPIRGNVRMFRYGERLLSSYEYDTLDLTKLGGSHLPEHHEVDEVERFFERSGSDNIFGEMNDPRMTTGATAFATMDDDGEYTGTYFRRPSTDDMVTGVVDGYRTWGAQTPEQESVGLSFKLRQMEHDSDAYFDNARFQVSNILWEFSPDGGRSTWYQLYELPNKPRCRVTLPNQTSQLRLRAVSNNPDEWVQSLSVKPIVDYQNVNPRPLSWDGDVEMDDFGYVTWDGASGGYGDPVYIVSTDYVNPMSKRAVDSGGGELSPGNVQGSVESADLMYDIERPVLRPILFELRIDVPGAGSEVSVNVFADTSFGAGPQDFVLDRVDGEQSITVSDDATGIVVFVTFAPASIWYADGAQGHYEYDPDVVYFEIEVPDSVSADDMSYGYVMSVFDGGIGEQTAEDSRIEVVRTRSTAFAPGDSRVYTEMVENAGTEYLPIYINLVDAADGDISRFAYNPDLEGALVLAVKNVTTNGSGVELPESTPLRAGYHVKSTVELINACRYSMSDAGFDSALTSESFETQEISPWGAYVVAPVGGDLDYVLSEADVYQLADVSSFGYGTLENHIVAYSTVDDFSTELTASRQDSFPIDRPLTTFPIRVIVTPADGGAIHQWNGEPLVEGDSLKILMDIENTSGAAIGGIYMVGQVPFRLIPQPRYDIGLPSMPFAAGDEYTCYWLTNVLVSGEDSCREILTCEFVGTVYSSDGSFNVPTFDDIDIPVVAPGFSTTIDSALEVLSTASARTQLVFSGDRTKLVTNEESMPFGAFYQVAEPLELAFKFSDGAANVVVLRASTRVESFAYDKVTFIATISTDAQDPDFPYEIPSIEFAVEVSGSGGAQNVNVASGDIVVDLSESDIADYTSQLPFLTRVDEIVGIIATSSYYTGGPIIYDADAHAGTGLPEWMTVYDSSVTMSNHGGASLCPISVIWYAGGPDGVDGDYDIIYDVSSSGIAVFAPGEDFTLRWRDMYYSGYNLSIDRPYVSSTVVEYGNGWRLWEFSFDLWSDTTCNIRDDQTMSYRASSESQMLVVSKHFYEVVD